jgi:hypothetical protein
MEGTITVRGLQAELAEKITQCAYDPVGLEYSTVRLAH